MKINAWLIFGIIGVSLFGSQFGIYYYRAVWGDAEIWWTPKAMALPLRDTRNEFELFFKDELLQEHLKRGALSATDQNGQPMPVVADDIAVRLNNWHKTRASFLHTAVYLALFLGAALMSLVFGIAQMLAGKKANKSMLRGS